jgi:hypothetical protein
MTCAESQGQTDPAKLVTSTWQRQQVARYRRNQ